MSAKLIEAFNVHFGAAESAIAKDLKLNFKRVFEDSALSSEEAALTVLALSHSLEFQALEEIATTHLKEADVGDGILQEARESAAIMGMLNIYYRFRHFIDESVEGEGYGAAKLRMQSFANPQLGKERFEMLAFALSVLNGCEKCVTSHEKALKQLGVTQEKIHDLARLTATVRGLSRL